MGNEAEEESTAEEIRGENDETNTCLFAGGNRRTWIEISFSYKTGNADYIKTTFTKYLGKGLGVKKTINSPTFTILKIYQGTSMPVYHIDAYRLEGITQDLGFEEYFEDDGVCVIEWPHFIESQLPEERLHIDITRVEGEDEKRMFTFDPKGKVYEKIVEAL